MNHSASNKESEEDWVPLATLAALALWFLMRPYLGVYHDGVLYLGQALNRLHPETFSKDLFFAYGSQDSFTLMPALYAWLIFKLGIAHASLLSVLTLLFCYFFVSAWVLKSWLPNKFIPFALVAMGATRYYGGWLTFSFSEPFLTARLLAEPIALLSIGLAARKRWFSSTVALVICALIHPLIAVQVFSVLAVAAILVNPRLGVINVLLLTIAALAAISNFFPFLVPRLLEQFDQEWFDVVVVRNEIVFPALWSVRVWNTTLACFLLFSFALNRAYKDKTTSNSILLSTYIVTSLFISATILGENVFHSVLVTQLQLWRVLWLFQFFALAIALVPAYHTWCGRKSKALEILGLALVAGGLSASYTPGGTAAILLASVFLLCPKFSLWLQSHCRFKLIYALAIIFTLLTIVSAAIFNFDWMTRGNNLYWRPFNAMFVTSVFFCIAIISCVPVIWTKFSKPNVARFFVFVLSCLALFFWDSRSSFQIAIEQAAEKSHPFSNYLDNTSRVLSYRHPTFVWAVLKQPNFYSSIQGAGVLFNRGTALEYKRRSEELVELDAGYIHCLKRGIGGKEHFCSELTNDTLKNICALKNGPTHVVSGKPIFGFPSVDWQIPLIDSSPPSLHLYRCADVLNLNSKQEF